MQRSLRIFTADRGNVFLAACIILLLFLIPVNSAAAEYETAEESDLLIIEGPLMIHGQQAGIISIGIGPAGGFFVNVPEIEKILLQRMNNSIVEEIFSPLKISDTPPWVSVESLPKNYLEPFFSQADLSLSLSIPPEYRLLQKIPVSGGTMGQAERRTVLDETDFSVFMNTYLNSSFEIDRKITGSAYSVPIQARILPTINLHQHTVSAAAAFSAQTAFSPDSASSFSYNLPAPEQLIDSLRYTYDFPQGPTLFQGGNISFKTLRFQSSSASKGIVLKNDVSYSSDTDLIRSPTIQILLEEDAEVSIFVNGDLSLKRKLPAGPYEFIKLPLKSGINTVQIQRIKGSETEEETYRFGYSSSLYPKNASSLNFGLGAASWDDFDTPAIFLNQTLGLSYNITSGYFLEIDPEKQVLGINNEFAGPFGNVNLDSAVRFTSSLPTGFKSNISYKHFLIGNRNSKSLSLNGSYQTRYFGTFSQDSPDNDTMFQLDAGYGQRLFDSIGISGRASLEIPNTASSDPLSGELTLSASLRPFNGFNISARGQLAWDKGFSAAPTPSGYISLSYYPSDKDYTFSTSVDGENLSSQINYSPENERRFDNSYSFQTSGSSLEDPVPDNIRLGTSFNNQYFNLNLNQYASKGTDDLFDFSTNAGIQSALVYTENTLALSRPVSNGFVLVKSLESFKGKSLLVNSSGSGVITSTEKADKAVVPSINSFSSSSINIQTKELEVGYELGDDRFTFNPSFSGAALAEIGALTQPVSVTGRFLTPEWKPIVFATGAVHTFNGEPLAEPIYLFTDDTGYFEIHQLTAGTYEMSVFSGVRRFYRLSIPEDAEGQYSLGTLLFGGEPLRQEFPPLGTAAQLNNLYRRLIEATFSQDSAYETGATEERGNAVHSLLNSKLEVPSPSLYPFTGGLHISGIFNDSEGRLLPNSKGEIYAFNKKLLKNKVSFATDKNGRFTFKNLKAGTYTFYIQGREKAFYRLTVPESLYGYRDIGTIHTSFTRDDPVSEHMGDDISAPSMPERFSQIPSLETIDITGTFIGESGEPAAHTYGLIDTYNGTLLEKEIHFFTNSAGEFRIEGLFPGIYEMDVHGRENKRYRITIPEGMLSGVKHIGRIEF
ncbi:MAG: hypothetical protein K9L24_04275 [Spirochaetia bacterium]|nr:hypothetical protein [Spirochaetia bacterium]